MAIVRNRQKLDDDGGVCRVCFHMSGCRYEIQLKNPLPTGHSKTGCGIVHNGQFDERKRHHAAI
jgi:hypothetical protein